MITAEPMQRVYMPFGGLRYEKFLYKTQFIKWMNWITYINLINFTHCINLPLKMSNHFCPATLFMGRFVSATGKLLAI